LVVVASAGCIFFAERMGPGGLLPGSRMITRSSDHPARRRSVGRPGSSPGVAGWR
jgi:hypothetical protein